MPTPYPILDFLLWGLLVVGATLRLTRFITSDSLGFWLFRERPEEWATRKDDARRAAILEVAKLYEDDPSELEDAAILALDRLVKKAKGGDPLTWQSKLVSGLSCPFCVGFWVGAALLVATLFLAPLETAGAGWGVLLAALSLNYLVGHVSARID